MSNEIIPITLQIILDKLKEYNDIQKLDFENKNCIIYGKKPHKTEIYYSFRAFIATCQYYGDITLMGEISVQKLLENSDVCLLHNTTELNKIINWLETQLKPNTMNKIANKLELKHKHLWIENKERFFPEAYNNTTGKTDKLRVQINNAHNILRVLRSIKNVQNLAYISSPITTGLEYYATYIKGDKVDYKSLIDHNVFEMEAELSKVKDIAMLIPARFTPVVLDWEQDHFMYLWYSVIGELSTEVRFVRDWEYSNGCIQEFTHAKQLTLGLPVQKNGIYMNTNETFEHNENRMKNMLTKTMNGKFIFIEDAINNIIEARDYINSMGFETEIHNKCLDILNELNSLGVK